MMYRSCKCSPNSHHGCCTHYRGNTINSNPLPRYYREFQSQSRGNTANTTTMSLFTWDSLPLAPGWLPCGWHRSIWWVWSFDRRCDFETPIRLRCMTHHILLDRNGGGKWMRTWTTTEPIEFTNTLLRKRFAYTASHLFATETSFWRILNMIQYAGRPIMTLIDLLEACLHLWRNSTRTGHKKKSTTTTTLISDFI